MKNVYSIVLSKTNLRNNKIVKHSDLSPYFHSGEYLYTTNSNMFFYDIHILSNESIIRDDYIYSKKRKNIYLASHDDDCHQDGDLKIIVTTSKLYNLPKLTRDFLNEFIQNNGIIHIKSINIYCKNKPNINLVSNNDKNILTKYNIELEFEANIKTIEDDDIDSKIHNILKDTFKDQDISKINLDKFLLDVKNQHMKLSNI